MSQQESHSDDIANSWNAFVRDCKDEFDFKFGSSNVNVSSEALNARLSERFAGDDKMCKSLHKSLSALEGFLQWFFGPAEVCFSAVNMIIEGVRKASEVMATFATLLERMMAFLSTLETAGDSARWDGRRAKTAKFIEWAKAFTGDSELRDYLTEMERYIARWTNVTVATILAQVSDQAQTLFTVSQAVTKLVDKQSLLELKERLGLHVANDADTINQAIDNRLTHHSIEGTGEWLLQSEYYGKWVVPGTDDELESSVLAFSAAHQTGKTYLSNIVIKHLRTRCSTTESMASLGFYYFFSDIEAEYGDNDADTLGLAVRSLVWQLAQSSQEYAVWLHAQLSVDAGLLTRFVDNDNNSCIAEDVARFTSYHLKKSGLDPDLKDEITERVKGSVSGDIYDHIAQLLVNIKQETRVSGVRAMLDAFDTTRVELHKKALDDEVQSLNKKLGKSKLGELDATLVWLIAFRAYKPVQMKILDEAIAIMLPDIIRPVEKRIKKDYQTLISWSKSPRGPVVFFRQDFDVAQYMDAQRKNEKVLRMPAPGDTLPHQEVERVRSALKTICRSPLYAKFGFDDFFDSKLGSAKRASVRSREGVIVNANESHVEVVRICLTAMCVHGSDVRYSNLHRVAVIRLADQLESMNLGQVDDAVT